MVETAESRCSPTADAAARKSYVLADWPGKPKDISSGNPTLQASFAQHIRFQYIYVAVIWRLNKCK